MFVVIMNEVGATPMHWGPFLSNDAAIEFMAAAARGDYEVGCPVTTYQIIRLTNPVTGV